MRDRKPARSEPKQADEAPTLEALLARVLVGDRQVLPEFVRRITPHVQVAVVGELKDRSDRLGGRDVRTEMQDQVQAALLVLFDDDARKLRQWRSDGGRSLVVWIKVSATLTVRAALRTKSRDPWWEEPVDAVEFAASSPDDRDIERVVHDADFGRRVVEQLRAQLPPKQRLVFERHVVGLEDADEICDELHWSRGRFRRNRSRLGAAIRRIVSGLTLESDI